MRASDIDYARAPFETRESEATPTAGRAVAPADRRDRHVRLRACVAPVVVASVVFGAGCGNSTGPGNTPEASRLAAHFDSIYTQATALANGGSPGYAIRAALMTYLEIPTALGAIPSNVRLATASGVEQWEGFEFEEVVTRGGVPEDSVYLMVAYTEPDAHTALLAFYGADGSIESGVRGPVGVIIANDTLIFETNTGGSTTTRRSLGGSCATPSTQLVNPNLTPFVSLPCASAKFTTSLALDAPSMPNVDPALTDLSFTAVSFNGERLVRELGP